MRRKERSRQSASGRPLCALPPPLSLHSFVAVRSARCSVHTAQLSALVHLLSLSLSLLISSSLSSSLSLSSPLSISTSLFSFSRASPSPLLAQLQLLLQERQIAPCRGSSAALAAGPARTAANNGETYAPISFLSLPLSAALFPALLRNHAPLHLRRVRLHTALFLTGGQRAGEQRTARRFLPSFLPLSPSLCLAPPAMRGLQARGAAPAHTFRPPALPSCKGEQRAGLCAGAGFCDLHKAQPSCLSLSSSLSLPLSLSLQFLFAIFPPLCPPSPPSLPATPLRPVAGCRWNTRGGGQTKHPPFTHPLVQVLLHSSTCSSSACLPLPAPHSTPSTRPLSYLPSSTQRVPPSAAAQHSRDRRPRRPRW